MYKIYDHDHYKPVWEYAGETMKDVMKIIDDRFDTIYWYDKDNCTDDYIEVWNSETKEIVVYHLYCGSWLGSRGEAPDKYVDFGPREGYTSRWGPTWATQNPEKDYIIV